jgi:methionyl-tRNA formyltransferase
LPQKVLDIAPKGFINIHASLLPQYRGSAPYQWAVLDGLKETGVSAQFMALEMDAGDVIDCKKTPIGPDETAGELLDKLAVLGADLLSQTLSSVENGTARATGQDPSQVTYAPMLDKSMCPIDFQCTAEQVHNKVRGLNPWPVATMQLQGKIFKVHATAVVENPANAPAGTILGLTKTGLQIACGEGAVEIRILQAEGGKRMPAPDYFRGHPLEA